MPITPSAAPEVTLTPSPGRGGIPPRPAASVGEQVRSRPPPRPPPVLMEADLSPLIRWGSSKRIPLPSADPHTIITTTTNPTAWNRLRPCGVELRLRHRQPLAGGG